MTFYCSGSFIRLFGQVEIQMQDLVSASLSDSENRLICCAESNEWFEPLSGEKDSPIRATLIRDLVANDDRRGRRWSRPDNPRPLLIRGALISGKLDLRGMVLNRTLWFEHCRFEDLVHISDCEVRTLSFKGSRLHKGLRARRTRVRGSLFLNSGFEARDKVNLKDIVIEGNLECTGGSFRVRSPEKHALVASNAQIGGNVNLNSKDHVFVSSGKVVMDGAKIAGDFECGGGVFHDGLRAQDLSCRCLFLNNGFIADGMVDLLGLRAQEQVTCRGGNFRYDGKKHSEEKWALRLRFAEIGSALLFSKTFADTEPYANATICGPLDLSQARCRIFRDSEDAWPPPGNLLLDGFSYERLHDCPTDWSTRSNWLRRQDIRDLHESFRPQPWTQAVNVLRDMGYDDDSRKLAIERNRAQIESRSTSRAQRVWQRFLGVTTGYGYRPQYALYWAFAFFLLGWFTFSHAYELGYMAPHNGGVVAYLATHPSEAVPPRYSEFNALVFATDTILPIIELGQNEAWEPTTKRAPDAPALPTDFSVNSICMWTLDYAFSAGLHRLIFWVEEIVGWVLVSLFIAGMSGMIKKE